MKYNEKEICEAYLAGKNQKEIADSLGTFNTSIRRILLRNGINLRDKGYAIRRIKEDPFKDLTVPGAQYWLGYIAADGNVASSKWAFHKNSIRLNCGQHDSHMLEQYAAWLGNGVPMLKKKHHKYGTFEYCVEFCHPETVRTLAAYGVTSAKSHTLKMNIPLTWEFVRGVFDGDGHAAINKRSSVPILNRVEICSGSEAFVRQICEFYHAEGISSAVVQQNAGIWFVRVYKQADIYKLYLKMYADASYFLSRKKEKFGSLVKKFTEDNLPKTGKPSIRQSRASM